MVTKRRKIMNRLKISKKKNNKKKKTLRNFKGGAAAALGTAAAGVAGTALAGATGLKIGSKIEEVSERLASPLKRGISDTATVAQEVVSGVSNTFSSIKDVVNKNYQTIKNRIKDNTFVNKDVNSLVNYCQAYRQDTDLETFKDRVKSLGSSRLKDCLCKEDKKNRKYPCLFTVLKILGYRFKKAAEFVLTSANFSRNEILDVIDEKETNCIHYCSYRGLLPILKIIFEDNDYLDDEKKEFSLNCWNKQKYNPLHYALKGNHRNNPDIVDFLLKMDTKGYYHDFENNLDESAKSYFTFLLHQKKNKSFSILKKMMENLIDHNLQLPIGKDFVETNSVNIFNNIIKYVQDKELTYSLQLSHLNDHSVNFYQCPNQDPSHLVNEENLDIPLEDSEFNFDSDNEDDIDEDGDKFINTSKEIEVFSSPEDIENSNNETLKKDIISSRIPSGKEIKILDEKGEYNKVKYGPTEGWVRKLDLLTPKK